MTTALPLSGIRVLELGQLVAAPSATRILADFGADVVKIESPEGDPLRTWGNMAPSGSSWWWSMQGRNKRLVSINLKDPQGQALVQEMARQADVFIQNLRPGRVAEWGLHYEHLESLNPSLIYVSISGYGLSGPYHDKPGFGHIAESMGGLRYITGFPEMPPVRTGISLGDEVAALHAVIGVLTALYRRAHDPQHRGDHVDVALTESVVSMTEALLPEYLNAGIIQERTGNQLLRSAPSNIYPTSDGKWVAIGANSTATFAQLLTVMNRQDLLEDARYTSNAGRVAHADDLDQMIGEWTAHQTIHEVIDQLDRVGVPAGPVMNARDIAHDPQMRERNMIQTVADPTGTPIGMLNVVPKLVRNPGRIQWAGGRIGEHTAEVLTELLSMTDQDVERLRALGIVR